MAKTVSSLDEIDQQTQGLADRIKQSVVQLAAQIASLNERYRRITGDDIANVEITGSNGKVGRGRSSAKQSAEQPAAKNGKAKRRVRRTTEELNEMASNIIAFIKRAGTEGVKGSAIKAEFGPILPSIKEFLKLYGGGKAIKSKGQKATMAYHHAE